MATKKVKEDLHPAWRPSFVNEAALPDTKVVRTNFLYNFGAIALLVCLLSFAVFNEFRIQVAKQAVASNQQEVDRLHTTHLRGVRQSTEFRKESEKLQQVADFSQDSLSRSELLVVLAEQGLEDIVLNSFSFRPIVATTGRGRSAKRTITYELVFDGTILDRDRAVELLEEFRSSIADSELLAPYQPRWTQDSFNRNVATNTSTFTGRFLLTPPAKS
ncbi:MAG: hypothetical protein Q7P63_17615 [Verrucomicrobiota bacterium JB022]|nr:hypothetical protein [Verrucomicrobiota bacterium JB022]